MINVTVDEIKTRKEKAISLLNAHTDKYRTFYAEISTNTDTSEEKLAELKRKERFLLIEKTSIENQLTTLNELENYVREYSE